MAKSTVNIEKIEDVDTDLLEKALSVILKELRTRSIRVADRDVNVGEPYTVYMDRHKHFCDAANALQDIPSRMKWAE